MTKFTVEDALVECRNREAARRDHADQEARRAAGVCRSGLGPDPIAPLDEAALIEKAERLTAERNAWLRSPRGRFVRACGEIHRAAGYSDEAETALGYYRRSFADEREPVNAHAVAMAIKALNEVPGNDAREARAALCDLLAANEDDVMIPFMERVERAVLGALS